MEIFLRETLEWEKFELLIDTSIFSKEVILKASYNFLDKGYFFFRYNEDNNIIVQFTRKLHTKQEPNIILLDFTDELLSVKLRTDLELDNKEIRERIIWAAIWNSLDVKNFSEINTDLNTNTDINRMQNQIDFDKDIDDILKEIESDPDLQINEEEIQRILKEIEAESLEEDIPKIMVNIEWVKKAKKNLSK